MFPSTFAYLTESACGRFVRADVIARDDGATAAEYAILITLIAAVIVGAVWAIGGSVTGFFEAVSVAF